MCSLFALSLAGVIHDAEPLESETDHHHKIDHEHATSHQSFKIHHFHAVPVYVKHEDAHYLKNPVEVGGVKHKLKVWLKKCVIKSLFFVFFEPNKLFTLCDFIFYVLNIFHKTQIYSSKKIRSNNRY